MCNYKGLKHPWYGGALELIVQKYQGLNIYYIYKNTCEYIYDSYRHSSHINRQKEKRNLCQWASMSSRFPVAASSPEGGKCLPCPVGSVGG